MTSGSLMTLCLLVPLLAAVAPASSQSCPQGISPAGNPACLPPMQSKDVGEEAPLAPRALGRWHTTYGAFYWDPQSGSSGVVTGKRSKREARSAALSVCARDGSRGCEELMTFNNQCAAVAAPVVMPGRLGVAWAPDSAEASRRSVRSCEETGGRSCQLMYSGCTKPVFEYF